MCCGCRHSGPVRGVLEFVSEDVRELVIRPRLRTNQRARTLLLRRSVLITHSYTRT